ncbi:MAG TPA: alpha/beta fold hydrolase [Gemmatimonadaceae bacterium]|nr:alpha/beta fold hydrolase [Gemmatimonadaceae bacterium]
MLPRLLRALATIAVATAPLHAQQLPSHHKANAEPVRVQRVRLSTGVELEVAERGRPDGQPVVFLHGFSDSRFSYSLLVPHLPEEIRAIVVTMRGHGESDKPACCFRISDFAADAIALLDALGIRQATLVGHSLGSFVVQRAAANHPDRIARLVLVGSGYATHTQPVAGLRSEAATLADPIPLEFARDFQQSSIAITVPPAFFQQVVAESRKVPARIWRAVLDDLVQNDAPVNHAKFGVATLIISGKRDAFWGPEHYDSLARAIPGARLLVYEKSGHAPNWEEPERVARDITAFVLGPETPTRGREQHSSAHEHESPKSAGPMPLLEGLGDWRMRVTTSSSDARRYFDQGVRLIYAFNHDEAVRSFERAAELDPACALCFWGAAYALGPNINLPMDPAAEPRALAAVRNAVSVKSNATARERALIEALAVRYGEPAGAARASRDSAFANRMRRVAQQYPDDPDIQVIFADAMLNLRPWNQWTRDGKPQPGTMELVAALERVIARTPDHAGACHLYVHAVEASNTPERALPCAERLPKLMPGAGHVVHMPAHVFLRVGRYEEAARANIAAVNADGRYFASRVVPDGIYPMFYAPHNLHFLWATYLLSGQKAKALSTARALQERVKPADARAVASLEGFLVSEALALARFGDWDAILRLPQPPAELRFVRAMWHYARGMAWAATGQSRNAAAALDSLLGIASSTPNDVIIILNSAPALMNVAADVLKGSIAASERKYDAAVAHYQSAAKKEDALTYDEPPPWYHSARNFLGEALLKAGRAAEAERAFREDLRFVRETGWSLDGLERALRAQGKEKDAAAVAKRRAKAWQYADVTLRRGG